MNHINNKFKLLGGALLIAGAFSSSAWAQAAKPAMPAVPSLTASAPQPSPVQATRAEVKAETKAAQRAGDIPQGEAGVTKDHPKGGAIKLGPTTKSSETSRPAVKAEARRAQAAGEVPRGEGNVTKGAPKGGQMIPKGTDTTRAAVKAEAQRAEKAGEITKGEASMRPKTL